MKSTFLLILSSVLKTTLVASLVFGSAWSLVRWAEYKSTLRADESGVLVLSATTAIVHGPGEIRLNTFKGVENIGWWDYDTQWLSWTAGMERAGSYEVELRYARPGARGRELELVVGDETLRGVAPGTGGFSQWKTITLGTIALREGAGRTLTLKAVDSPSPPIINFVSLTLRRVE